MMKFLNLNTGYSFDALWKNDQEKGYIFWFPNEQGIELTYTMPIAIVTDTESELELTMESNDIFYFIHMPETMSGITIDGYCFDGKFAMDNETAEPNDFKYSHHFTTIPEKINGKYVHVFNIACCSKNAGEYICKINIGDNGYIRVGADFYGEHEPIYVNLANMGVEIPTSIQKAIYDTNVHEDITDNILINRKFKELMSNYWNIIANKGSYKSLLNSIEWFEWNDQVKLKEIYKRTTTNKILFNDKDILTSLNDNVEETLNNFIKTTYISLYCSLQDETPNYDNEYNPQLANAVFKWSKNDIQLKIALFAKFFGVYFLPIHLSILHATAEDTVFTNTIKSIHAGKLKRNDSIGCFDFIECNIKTDSVFGLTNVRAQVTDDTVFGVKYPNTVTIGVDKFPSDNIVDESSIKTFSEQYYTGPGAIIPINLIIPNVNQKDFIKETIIEFIDDTDKVNKVRFNTIFKPIDNKIIIDFNFLAKTAKKYTMLFTFIFGSSKTLTRSILFTVEDIDNININIYKVQAKNDTEYFSYEDFRNTENSNYFYKIQNSELDLEHSYYTQYLPYLISNDSSYTGIKLNRTIVVDVKSCTDKELQKLRTDMVNTHNYLEFAKYEYNIVDTKPVLTDKLNYLIFVSKKFYADYPYNLLKQYKIVRNDLVFYPQFHNLVKMDGTNINNYTIAPHEAICCAAELMDGNIAIPFKYGHMITEAEWVFYNHLTNETIQHPVSVRTPFIAKQSDLLSPGYYDITFKYSLNNGTTQECKLNSAFRIKAN